MKIDINDPRITAFALGELTGNDATEIARAMRSDSRIRNAVDEVRETASLLHETLGGGKVQLLTADQRAAVRHAGEGPLIEDIASAKVSFWKTPAVAGIGVAAAVALGIFFMNQRPEMNDVPVIVADDPAWDWSQVDLENLTSPVIVDSNDGAVSAASASSVAAAVSEDTPSFRRELHRRIAERDLKSPVVLPDLVERDWEVIAGKESTEITVPLASGATSWPLIQRYIDEQGTLPPRQAVRIEEMVNHFSYKAPAMLKGGGLVADMELCHSPWNPTTILLAVHVSSDSHAEADANAALVLNRELVRRVRILGYAGLKADGDAAAASAGPCRISKSHGNYVIYEIEPILSDLDESAVNGSFVTLKLNSGSGQELSLGSNQVSSWLNASADLRFASTVAATGMLLSSTSSMGELDGDRLLSLLSVINKKDVTSISSERKAAVGVIKKVATFFTQTSENRD